MINSMNIINFISNNPKFISEYKIFGICNLLIYLQFINHSEIMIKLMIYGKICIITKNIECISKYKINNDFIEIELNDDFLQSLNNYKGIYFNEKNIICTINQKKKFLIFTYLNKEYIAYAVNNLNIENKNKIENLIKQ